VRWPHAGYFPRLQHLLHRGASVGAGEIDRRADRLRQGQSEALNYAAGNTYALVATAMFATNNGITMHAVPYKSEPDAIPDLLSCRVRLMNGTSTNDVSAHVKEGKLTVLATTFHERGPLMPDVPSFPKAG
jgi:tripartite-type tricarboxylate transporter receptor subunit TctC